MDIMIFGADARGTPVAWREVGRLRRRYEVSIGDGSHLDWSDDGAVKLLAETVFTVKRALRRAREKD
jgi:hypothetical protein